MRIRFVKRRQRIAQKEKEVKAGEDRPGFRAYTFRWALDTAVSILYTETNGQSMRIFCISNVWGHIFGL